VQLLSVVFSVNKEVFMGAKEFFTAIDMLDTYNEIMKVSEREAKKCDLRLSTRELGRYRSYVYREKMLRKDIMELTQSRMRAEKLISQQGELKGAFARDEYRRGRSKMIDLWLELSKVVMKRRELERLCGQISDSFIKKVVVHRYFEGENSRLHTWAQTACELGLPMTGVQLRKTVVSALEFGEM
jgi:hypothetical protein